MLWKNSAMHNGLLLTEQCDNYCLMCSQPPKDRDDSWLFDRARKVISLLPVGSAVDQPHGRRADLARGRAHWPA